MDNPPFSQAAMEAARSLPRDYFDSADNVKRLLAELESWRGTPFMDGMGTKGQGADCVRFVERVLVQIGAIRPVRFPPYVTRGGGAAMLRTFRLVISGIPQLRLVWEESDGPERRMKPQVKRGDVFLISTGEAMHHLAIVAIPPTVWHCLRGVGEASIFDPVIEHHLQAVYRVQTL